MKAIREFLEGKIVKFNGFNCIANVRPYGSGHVYMQLMDTEDGQPVARASLNIDYVPVIENMIIIKSYGENEGIYEALLEAGVISKCERKYPIGFESAHVCFFAIPDFVVPKDVSNMAEDKPLAKDYDLKPKPIPRSPNAR